MACYGDRFIYFTFLPLTVCKIRVQEYYIVALCSSNHSRNIKLYSIHDNCTKWHENIINVLILPYIVGFEVSTAQRTMLSSALRGR
jgi:hypothetical protein